MNEQEEITLNTLRDCIRALLYFKDKDQIRAIIKGNTKGGVISELDKSEYAPLLKVLQKELENSAIYSYVQHNADKTEKTLDKARLDFLAVSILNGIIANPSGMTKDINLAVLTAVKTACKLMDCIDITISGLDDVSIDKMLEMLDAKE